MRAALSKPPLPAGGLDDPAERHAAGRLIGLLWIIGGVSGGLWYLVPGADLEHWRLGMVTASFSAATGIACVLAPWPRMSPVWIYVAAGLSLLVIPVVMAVNGGADSPTVLYLFMASVLFGYFLPTRAAIVFLSIGALIPATPMLYDPEALNPTYVARVVLTAPIYAGVGLTVVIAKRQLVRWRNQAVTQALVDPLTGLANRRALTEALGRALGAPKPAPLALVLVDLDDFKAVNTTSGYVGGDRVLRGVAEILRRSTRDEDLVARLGGNEFAILVPAGSDRELAALAARIVEAIHGVEVGLGPAGDGLTASVGYAVIDGRSADIEAVIEAADRELRRAKLGGKDRWTSPGEARGPAIA